MDKLRETAAELFAWVQTDAGAAAMAGAAGGLVRWLTLREKPRDGVAALVVGSICALYLGPLVEPMLAPAIGALNAGTDPIGFSSFVVGLGGIGISGFVIETLRRFQTDRGADNGEK